MGGGADVTLILGLVALVVLVVGVGLVLVRGAREARDEQGPASRPTDFVAPVSSGRYRWRAADETEEQFREKVRKDGESVPPGDT